MRRGQRVRCGALCRKHQAPLRSRLSDLRRQISCVVTLKEPLISIPVCTTESTVAASTRFYELGERLSRIGDKTDKTDSSRLKVVILRVHSTASKNKGLSLFKTVHELRIVDVNSALSSIVRVSIYKIYLLNQLGRNSHFIPLKKLSLYTRSDFNLSFMI